MYIRCFPEVHWFLVAKEVLAHTSGALLLKQHSLLPILRTDSVVCSVLLKITYSLWSDVDFLRGLSFHLSKTFNSENHCRELFSLLCGSHDFPGSVCWKVYVLESNGASSSRTLLIVSPPDFILWSRQGTISCEWPFSEKRTASKESSLSNKSSSEPHQTCYGIKPSIYFLKDGLHLSLDGDSSDTFTGIHLLLTHQERIWYWAPVTFWAWKNLFGSLCCPPMICCGAGTLRSLYHHCNPFALGWWRRKTA